MPLVNKYSPLFVALLLGSFAWSDCLPFMEEGSMWERSSA